MTGLNLTLAEAAAALNLAAPKSKANLVLNGVSTDSRTIEPGQLFVALRGENFDGHDYLQAAFDRGAAAAVVSAKPQGIWGLYLETPDTLRALGDLAAYVLRRQKKKKRNFKVAALTGSNGKTTTKEMLTAIIGRKGPVLATRGNFNNEVGLPLTVFGLRPEHRAAVLEMGMNHPGEIARLTAIARPDLGLVTNAGPAHLEFLGSVENVARAKGELFAGLGPKAAAVVNLDDPLITEQAQASKGPRITFGFSPGADVRAVNLDLHSLSGIRFRLKTADSEAPCRMRLLGRHNAANALAAAAAALALGVSIQESAEALAGFAPFPGRLELKPMPAGWYILDDTYNANPASMSAALLVARSIRGRGRLAAVLGDMLELGEAAAFEHDLMGRTAAAVGLDILVAVGPEAKAMVKGAKRAENPPAQIKWFPEAEEAARWLKPRLRPEDRILVKGSRGMRMERAVSLLGGEVN